MLKSIELFSSAFVEVLKSQIQERLDSYKLSDSWALSTIFPGRKSLFTKLNADLAIDFVPAHGNVNNDAQNAVLVHHALSQLTPAQASDERLWSRLCHVELWPYMRSRWPIERFTDSEKAARFILARYFVPQSQGRSVLRNGIARLWWAAHLTVDQSRDNPYELTEILLSRLDITQQILERSMGRSQVLLVAFLDFLRLNKEQLLISGEKSRYEIRQLAKFLNLTGGVKMLDGLNGSDIIELLAAELERLSVATEA